MREALLAALSRFTGNGAPMRDRAAALFGTLGYHSDRTLPPGSVNEFVASLGERKQLTDKQRTLFKSWRSADIVFQITGDEIGDSPGLFQQFDKGRAKSFLFVAADLKDGSYNRTTLGDMTRAVNRGFAMPVIVLFRHGGRLTLAAVHRRAHKQDDSRDVLERVTLIKDIRTTDPHRAHIEILVDLALPKLIKEEGVRDFDDLHAAWEGVLDIETLNRRFYSKLFGWFQRAVEECRFPDDGAGGGSTERHVIRLITRLLFIWFMREKGLIPGDLFKEDFARTALKNHAAERTDYYRAVLQNLFFATLNTEITKRAFSGRSTADHRDFTKYRYRDLLTDPDGFVEELKQVPFVNGGLFDCLDDFAALRQGGRRIDAFTDNIENQGPGLDVPSRLLLDEEGGLFPLFRGYKFTVEESTPIDREVALDPELLGRVFENLLAAYNPETRATVRKQTGSYYTPRRVVDYMVREALTEALAAKSCPSVEGDEFWRKRLDYLLDHSDAMDDADDLFEESEKRTVVAAVANLKVLDPAAGSGAFLMGVLQTLTLALRRLDPDNELWKEVQKARAKERAGAAFDTPDRRQREDELRDISDMFEKYGSSDFGRKLYLIQNGIYGVDIQPVACQIAKLRFFISLTIEQERDPDAPNLGIRPLPNLETRILAANALIGLGRKSQGVLGNDIVRELETELATLRERYFSAGSRAKKLQLRKEDKAKREELGRKLENLEFGHDNAKAVALWDPYDQNEHADWFDPEWMFGVTDGFDAVIGNPPYIQLQKDGGRLGKYYKDKGYETFASTGDIYQLFYERGGGLLKSGSGVTAFITSNSWLKAEYGKKLRRWFAERHTPLRLIEMGKGVFKNAIVDTATLIVRNGTGQPVTCPAVDIDQASDDRFPPPAGDWGTLQPEGERPWMALSSIERSVMEKMEAVGTPLRDWDISIYRGILTGYNDAFIVNQATRDALIAADPRSAELLKPVLRGRDIARYRAKWAGRWLISTFPSLGLDIDDYPAIKRHLLSFGKERLAQEGRRLPGGGRSRKKTPNAWYELQDTCAYHEDFNGAKLLWRDMAETGAFAYSDTAIFTNDKAFMMTGVNLKFLCAVLNSSAVSWLVSKFGLTTGMGLTQWKKFVVEAIPIVCPNAVTLAKFDEAVAELLSMIDVGNSEAVRGLDDMINQMVFNLYGLTAPEAKALMHKGN